MADEQLARVIAEDLRALCSAGPDRHVGGPGGTAANDWVADRLSALGYSVERLAFACMDWRQGSATLSAGDLHVDVWPGPYSPPATLRGHSVVAASSEEELGALAGASGKVLFLHGALVAEQLTPRNYPFYAWESHSRILGHLDRLSPAAVLAATGSNPDLVGALSPYPYVEDADFEVASAYMRESDTEKVLAAESVNLIIDSDRFACEAEQVVGTLASGRARRVVISAHIDSRFGTPGALDNAAGVACMLAAASLVARRSTSRLTVEVLPFNGEDNFAAYGEMAYLASRHHRFEDIALAVNIDAAGYRGHNTAVSTYGLTAHQEKVAGGALGRFETVEAGPQWPASDHMIFAMKGVPAVAVTTCALREISSKYTHTAADLPELVDPDLLSDAAEWIADVVMALDAADD